MKDEAIWRLLDSGAGNAAWNMAVDEALLLLAADGASGPTLRFFSWNVPSLSIGSFQGVEELDMESMARKGVPLVRRPTGGRAVLHDEELTYSVVCPIPSVYFPSDLMGSYGLIGSCFLEGLGRLGVEASLVPVAKNPDRKNKKAAGVRDPACFSSPSWHEVLAGGRKLIGCAQRRLMGAFLQQGSLIVRQNVPALLDLLAFRDEDARDAAEKSLSSKMTSLSEHIQAPDMDSLKAAIADGFKSVLRVNFSHTGLSRDETLLAERLYSEKYSTDGWNMRRLRR